MSVARGVIFCVPTSWNPERRFHLAREPGEARFRNASATTTTPASSKRGRGTTNVLHNHSEDEGSLNEVHQIVACVFPWSRCVQDHFRGPNNAMPPFGCGVDHSPVRSARRMGFGFGSRTSVRRMHKAQRFSDVKRTAHAVRIIGASVSTRFHV